MTNELTILFLNAGRRVELIRAFRSAFLEAGIRGRIVCTDIQRFAPAIYLGDSHFILPRSDQPEFAQALTDVCRRESVGLIVPLIDPDLLVLARQGPQLRDSGTLALVSPPGVIKICRDKTRSSRFFQENDLPTPRILTLAEAKQWSFPLFLKPKAGSASQNTFRIENIAQLEFFAHYVPDPLIQEFATGDEYTVDVFSDWSGRPLQAVPRRRLRVRAGEVSVGRVERNTQVEDLCIRAAKKLGTLGPINIQAIVGDGSIQLTEINPRFGGGVPLSIAAGAPFPYWVILMALQRPIPSTSVSLREGLTMLRYDDSMMVPQEHLQQ
jgi:carbamoyl-phosphate synthase large subunit